MIPLHIGFSGTRYGMTLLQRRAVYRVFRWYRDNRSAITVHHGSCVGADAEAHDIARMLGLSVALHPGVSAKGDSPYRAECATLQGERVWTPRHYFTRNAAIVACTGVLVAATGDGTEDRGASHAISCAVKLERPVVIVSADGRLQRVSPLARCEQGTEQRRRTHPTNR